MAEADSVPTGDEAPAKAGSPTSAVIELPPPELPGAEGGSPAQAAPAPAEPAAVRAAAAELEPDATESEAESADAAEAEAEGAPPQDAESGDEEAEPAAEDAEAGAEEAESAGEEAEPAPEEAEPEEPPREPKPGALALLKLEKLDDDGTYRLRPEGEVDTLATSMARLGQLFPVDLRIKPPDRFQVICGFRRVAALRLLKRERVLARVHTDLSDEDALRLALADLIEHRGASREELEALKARLESEHRLTPRVKDTLERALAPVEEGLGPEEVQGGEEEVDLDELAQDITRRLAGINQDLALVTELWSAMEPSLRRALLDQLTYPEQLAAYLRSL